MLQCERVLTKILLGLAIVMAIASHQLIILSLALLAGRAVLSAVIRPFQLLPAWTDLACLLLLLLGVLSWLISVDRPATLLQVLHLALFVMLVQTGARFVDLVEDAVPVLGAFAVLGVAIALSAPMLVEEQPDKFLGIPLETYFALFRFRAVDSASPNVLAGALAMLLPAILFGMLQRNVFSPPTRVVFLFSFLFMSLVAIILQSRGALLGAGIGCLAAVALNTQRLRILAIPIAIFPIIVGLLMYGFEPSWVAFADNASLDSRAINWLCGRYLAQDFLLTGAGMGNFNFACMNFYPELMIEQQLPYTHSLLLQIGVDLGVIGVAACALLILSALAYSFKAVWQGPIRQDAPVMALAGGIFASITAAMTHGLVDAIPWGTVKPAPVFWLIVGLGIGLSVKRHAGETVSIGHRAAPATQTAHLPTDSAATADQAPG